MSIGQLVNYMETRIQEPFYSWMIALYNWLQLKKNPERRISNGEEYPDKIFYVIRIAEIPTIGIASYYDKVLGSMEYAARKGYVPVVDISDPVNSIVDEERGGNPWEYYYQGIETNGTVYALKDTEHAKQVVYSCPSYVNLYKRFSKKEIANRYNCTKRIPYNENTQTFFQEMEKEIVNTGSMVGVYYRGTDYRKRGNWNPVGHPKVMDIEDFCVQLRDYIDQVQCSRIFFVTEEQEALEYANQAFSDTDFHFIEKKRFSNFQYTGSISARPPESVSKFDNNRLYLLDLDILSKCTYLFGPFCSGIQMALNMNGNHYMDVHILDIGRN